MNIMELGAIGEMVGGVAVLVTLIYLALQVRQNNEQARQSNAIERGRANREITRDFNEMTIAVTDAELMQLLRQGMANFEALSRNDQARLHSWLTTRVIHSTGLFLGARDGLVDEQYVQTFVNAWAAWIKTPGLYRWWSQAKPLLHQEFVSEIDRLASADSLPSIGEVFPWFLADDTASEA